MVLCTFQANINFLDNQREREREREREIERERKRERELCSGQIKISVFRVTLSHINLLVKPRFFSGFLVKTITLCIMNDEIPFKMHNIIFLSRKTNN